MKRFLAILLLVSWLGLVCGCGPKTERTVRREEQRNRTIQRNLEGLPDDIEAFWLTDKPLRLHRYEGP